MLLLMVYFKCSEALGIAWMGVISVLFVRMMENAFIGALICSFDARIFLSYDYHHDQVTAITTYYQTV